MAQFLRGKNFQSVADVEVAVEEYFASKDRVVLPGVQGIGSKMGEDH
jgi:hypothetical protein